MVALILRAAARRGAPEVRACFTPTGKNRAFAGFYPALGFGEAPPAPAPAPASRSCWFCGPRVCWFCWFCRACQVWWVWYA